MPSFAEVSSSAGLVFACMPVIALCVVQSLVMMKRAYKAGLAMGLTNIQMNKSIRAGVITAVAPSCAIGVGVIALMAVLGGPYSWLRMSDIGALTYEMINIGLITESLGTAMNAIDSNTFTCIVWVMAASTMFWQINVALLAPTYDKMLTKVTHGDSRILTFIILSCMIAIFSKIAVPNLIHISLATAAVLIGVGSMSVMTVIIKKFNMKWLKEWALPFAMLLGMFGALLFK